MTVKFIFILAAFSVLFGVTGFLRMQQSAETQARIQEKANQVGAGIQKLAAAGRNPSEVAQILKELDPFLKANKFDEAENVLDRALALIRSMEKDQPQIERPVQVSGEPQYLQFQMFIFGPQPDGKAQHFNKTAIAGNVDEVLTAVGGLRGDGKTRQIGFSVGPLALDHTDEELRVIIRESFKLAEEKDVAVAFHIDDSMFWLRRSDLWKDPLNTEWVDWNRTVPAHRMIGWADNGKPLLAPPMNYTSPAVRKEIGRVARDVIGAEIKKGLEHLKAGGKERLFAGVIAGWETRLDDDYQPRRQVGYGALHHLGFNAKNLPKDFDYELERVIQDWMMFWAKSLSEAGIPRTRIYTHIPVTADQLHTPLWTAFNEYSRPGFSVYLGTHRKMDTFTAILTEMEKQKTSFWANSEGTNVNMVNFMSSKGVTLSTLSWDDYLRKQFSQGAALVNIFAWQEPADGPSAFGRATHQPEAIEAYRKFLSGDMKW